MGYIGAGITRFNTADELTVTGDAQIDTTTLVVDSTNNRVGVGTASPATALDVTGTALAHTVEIGDGSAGGTSEVVFSDNVSGRAKILYDHGASPNEEMGFEIAGTRYMTIENGGNVGIGTDSPSTNLEINGGTNNNIVRIVSTDANANIEFADNTTTSGLQIGANGDNMKFGISGAEAMRITAAGNVGIGTASPSEVLTVAASASNARISITDTDSLKSAMVGLVEFDGTDGRNGYIGPVDGNMTINTDGGYPIKFQTNGTEAARIDSSQNLLVGTTNSAPVTSGNVNGISLQATGGNFQVNRASGIAAYFGRKTNDGEIVQFRKDGTAVGSIGSFNGNAYYAGTGCGLRPRTGDISPTNAFGSTNDGGVDLGTSSNRFQNIWLSGGAYIGGTATANKLDDYEEGTFTPSFTSTGASFSYGVQGGNYTKVGRLVMCSFRLSLNATPTGTTSNVVYLSGLPFSSATLSQTYHGGSIGHYFGFNLSATGVVAYQTVSGTSTAELKVVGDNLGETAILASHLNSNAEIRGQVIYHTS
jgi:hypothetical protein